MSWVGMYFGLGKDNIYIKKVETSEIKKIKWKF